MIFIPISVNAFVLRLGLKLVSGFVSRPSLSSRCVRVCGCVQLSCSCELPVVTYVLDEPPPLGTSCHSSAWLAWCSLCRPGWLWTWSNPQDAVVLELQACTPPVQATVSDFFLSSVFFFSGSRNRISGLANVRWVLHAWATLPALTIQFSYLLLCCRCVDGGPCLQRLSPVSPRMMDTQWQILGVFFGCCFLTLFPVTI